MVRPTKLEAKLECTTAPAPTYVLLAHARPHNAMHSPSILILNCPILVKPCGTVPMGISLSIAKVIAVVFFFRLRKKMHVRGYVRIFNR